MAIIYVGDIHIKARAKERIYFDRNFEYTEAPIPSNIGCTIPRDIKITVHEHKDSVLEITWERPSGKRIIKNVKIKKNILLNLIIIYKKEFE